MVHDQVHKIATILFCVVTGLSPGLRAWASTPAAIAIPTMRQDQEARSPDIH